MFRRHFKTALFVIACALSAAGWWFLVYEGNRAKDPMEIVRKHFVFYPDYSHGVWRDAPCDGAKESGCREVTYATPVGSCGLVTFRWRVFNGPEADTDAPWAYEGPTPNFDESKYPLYAILNPDSRLIDSPALGRPPPSSCPLE